MDLYGSNNQPLNTEQLHVQLKHVVRQSKEVETPIGLLTTENRNKWAKSYELLLKGQNYLVGNKMFIQFTSLFEISL